MYSLSMFPLAIESAIPAHKATSRQLVMELHESERTFTFTKHMLIGNLGAIVGAHLRHNLRKLLARAANEIIIHK
jgi:hypothetical protein